MPVPACGDDTGNVVGPGDNNRETTTGRVPGAGGLQEVHRHSTRQTCDTPCHCPRGNCRLTKYQRGAEPTFELGTFPRIEGRPLWSGCRRRSWLARVQSNRIHAFTLARGWAKMFQLDDDTCRRTPGSRRIGPHQSLSAERRRFPHGAFSGQNRA